MAKNLYTSNARFVFELLQNTEDNAYTAAQAAGDDPFVSFRLFPDRLIVDCNEDGFNAANLTAICDVGQSSKTTSQGYIGEKGIGFKSVFMAAWKVHIQSGHLSFNFVHRKGDSGMGMVMPRWHKPTGTLPHLCHTRITLFLHEEVDIGEDGARRNRDDIREQLRGLEPALLLFVSKLKKIEVIFHDSDGQQEWATQLSRRPAEETVKGRVVLERRVTDTANLDDVEPESHIYHVVEHMSTNVPKRDNTEFTAAEKANPAASQSKIVLAFPLSEDGVPIIEPQKVFAFLPMSQKGFNVSVNQAEELRSPWHPGLTSYQFLIQAYFVTQANREDVVTSSPRNKDLIRGITDATIEAIRELCEDKDLRYTWMRYLPLQNSHHWDPFWQTLVDGIKKRLQVEPVVRTRGKDVLRRINELRFVQDMCRDALGEPLFLDLDPEIYLSELYQKNDIDILFTLGLSRMYIQDVITAAKQDLSQQNSSESPSRLQSQTAPHEWQTRASALLLLPWSKEWKDQQAGLRDLPLIPLQDGSWVRAIDNDLFYGDIGTVQIPSGLGLNLVATWASAVPTRRKLFDKLGVTQATIHTVRSRILSLHSRAEAFHDKNAIGLDRSLEHLTFLYLTHWVKAKDEPAPQLVISDGAGWCWHPSDHRDLYIHNSSLYGAGSRYQILNILMAAGAISIHPGYFNKPPCPPDGATLTWTEWLHDYVGVRRKFRLVNREQTSLSAECKYIAERHNDKLLGFLKHVWLDEGGVVANSETIQKELRQLSLPCTNGKRLKPNACYMPLGGLRRVCRRFADEEIMPFLDLGLSQGKDASIDDSQILTEWSFLTKVLGVNVEDGTVFRVDLLNRFLAWSVPGLTTQRASKLLELYRYIDASVMGAERVALARMRVR